MNDEVTPPRFRLRQFSIRSLLLIATVIAIVLGVWVGSIRRQGKAVSQLRALGADVGYEPGLIGQWLPDSIHDTCGDDAFSNAAAVSISYRAIQGRMVTPTSAELDRALGAVQQLPRASHLHLHTLKLRDAYLAKLTVLKDQIRNLSINELFHYGFTGAGVVHLGNWPELNTLSILTASSEITDNLDLTELARNPKLEDLTIGCGTLDERIFAEMSAIKSLKHIRLYRCRFDGRCLKQLRALPNLQSIMLHNTHGELDPPPVRRIGDGPQERGKFDFRFEISPEYGPIRDRRFPEQEYQRWLRDIVPGVRIDQLVNS